MIRPFSFSTVTQLLPQTRIFFLCCKSSANMTLLFVDLKYILNLGIENGIFPAQPFAHVLMYCTLADAEMSRG